MLTETGTAIRVAFVLDKDGNPEYRQGDTRRHYTIKVSLASPPDDAWSTTFFLDPTYYDRVRETRRPNFSFETTTFGDYIIQAKVFRKKTSDVASVNVSDALKAEYAGTANEAIKQAIQTIEKN
jgi:hypothetical protein